MPLTEYGIKAMGFKEIPSNTKIEAYFNSAALYSIEGINIKKITPESYSDLSYHNEVFSFLFGNSINKISRRLIGDDFVDDEESWKKENNIRPPYFIIHFKINDPFFCSTGFWKRDEEHLLTYNCFSDAKKELKEKENKIIPSLISSLTVQLSKINNPIRFRLINRTIYAKTSEDEFLFDLIAKFSAQGYTSKNVLPNKISDKIKDSLDQYLSFEPRVASLFYSGLKEKDRFKQFMNLYQSLEIYIHKTFKKIDFEKHVDNVNSSPKRLEKTAREFFINRQTQNKNLTQRFMWCAILKWKKLKDSDVEKFKKIKKTRDALSHGEKISESNLQIEELENLLLKVF
ncbi:MAG TPA: hypothetical protein VJ962_12370 [Clostridia bacterium]|nr:hypothetical protein [Clostridia bacterium]